MKKGVLFILLILLFLFPIVAAQVNETQINTGFACLNSLVSKTTCPSLTIGEQIFASLANGNCTSQIASSSNNGCWPSGSCDIKTTAQAVLALQNSGLSTSNSVSWLTSQKITTPDLNWYLQIDANTNSSCTVSYSQGSYTLNFNPDKSINSNTGTGTCLSVSPNGYWLSVSPSCYSTPLVISCNQTFTTTNLYQRQDYPTIYVSSFSNSASSGGKVTDSINSSCFGSGGTCNYEGTLWATLALNSLNGSTSISSFLPYLTVMADDPSNLQYLPYSFLYALTSSPGYLNTLLSEQKTVNNQNYWDQGSPYGPYYDTALALLPIQSQNPQEKINAVDWLMSVQGPDGCWHSGDLLDTAFILYSISGSQVQHTSTVDCISSGNYCISGTACQQAGGSILSGYCAGANIYICCSKQLVVPSCASQGGTLCNASQTCTGSVQTSSDTSSGRTCCVGGACPISSPVLSPSDCEKAGGTCRSTSCLSNEQSSGLNCALSSETCCLVQQSSGTSVWIWIFLILIVLVVIGIIFRKKLRVLWFRIKSKFKGGGKTKPGYPPRPPFPPRPGPPVSFQRRPMFPPPQPQRLRQKPSEVNDVLKKLREIGK